MAEFPAGPDVGVGVALGIMFMVGVTDGLKVPAKFGVRMGEGSGENVPVGVLVGQGVALERGIEVGLAWALADTEGVVEKPA